MAPTLEDVTGLKELVKQLQDRIHKIEQSIVGNGDVQTPSEQLRMILMGPPGAGKFCSDFFFPLPTYAVLRH